MRSFVRRDSGRTKAKDLRFALPKPRCRQSNGIRRLALLFQLPAVCPLSSRYSIYASSAPQW